MPSGTVIVSLLPTRYVTSVPDARSTTATSGVTSPATTDSPRPQFALMTTVFASAVERVDGEHDAGRVGGHELLHDDGDANLARLDTAAGAVTDGPRRP